MVSTTMFCVLTVTAAVRSLDMKRVTEIGIAWGGRPKVMTIWPGDSGTGDMGRSRMVSSSTTSAAERRGACGYLTSALTRRKGAFGYTSLVTLSPQQLKSNQNHNQSIYHPD